MTKDIGEFDADDKHRHEVFQLEQIIKSLEAKVRRQTERVKERAALYEAEMRATANLVCKCGMLKSKLVTTTRQRNDLMEALKYLLGQCENFDSVTSIPEVRSAMRCAKAAIANAGGWPITIDGEVPNE